jgi:predicted SprT family Zn-dependent metalloprotease
MTTYQKHNKTLQRTVHPRRFPFHSNRHVRPAAELKRYTKMKEQKMSKKTKYSMGIVFFLIASFVAYSLLFGKLFPYSPVIIGFSKNELKNTIVYIQKGTKYTDLKVIDSLIPKVESFHELKFIKKPRIFIFKDKSSYYQRSISKARFCAFYNGDVAISPWALQEAENGEISLEIYLRHELSHALLFQHSGIIRASQYPAWLLEGIAVYSANQMGTSWYPSKNETYSYIRKGNFVPPEYFKTKKEDQINLDVKYRTTFMYSEFACIVDYLIEKYGKDKFLLYMKACINNNEHDKLFKEIYGIDFNRCIQDFKESVAQG